MPELLKDFYDKDFFIKISRKIKQSYPKFDDKSFSKNIFDGEWQDRELKARMRHITLTLKDFLPENFCDALVILKSISEKSSGFEYMFLPDFVEVYGLDDLETSIPALEFFTQHSSSEFAVRPLIIKYQKQMMRQMNLWSKSENHHVRRLASEGCRPRLPWAMALPVFKKDPALILPILKRLKADKSEYVRRSVANNLNDISKDNPDVVIELAKKWLGQNNSTDWVVKHGCRTLLKSGNTEIMRLFGFKSPVNIDVGQFKVTKNVLMGAELEFEFELISKKNKLGKLRLEYAIEYVRKNNKSNKKVFKISEGVYESKKLKINKKYSFRPISTRNYYPGRHAISIIVNGKEIKSKTFILYE